MHFATNRFTFGKIAAPPPLLHPLKEKERRKTGEGEREREGER